jgi:ribosomal protein S18 acetylase RimI-like enzyme
MIITEINADNDIKIIQELAVLIWYECYKDVIMDSQIQYMLENIQNESAIRYQLNDNYKYYLIVNKNKNIGYFSCKKTGDEQMFLSKIYVQREFRKQGIGSKIIQFIENHSKKNNISKINLRVNKNNAQAIQFYETIGFIKIGEIQTDIGGDYIMDDYIYEKCI